jgi:hypothetical protein
MCLQNCEHVHMQGRIWAYATLCGGQGPILGGVHNFVYPSTYIPIHVKNLQGLAQHVPYGPRHRLDFSRSSQPIAIVTSPIATVSSLRAYATNLGPIYIRLRAYAANLAKGPAQHRSGPVHMLLGKLVHLNMIWKYTAEYKCNFSTTHNSFTIFRDHCYHGIKHTSASMEAICLHLVTRL